MNLHLLLIISIFTPFSLQQEQEEEPLGHLKPIGSSSELLSVEVRDDLPNPIEFFEKYVKASKPVLFRGAAKRFPSFNHLRNDTYLKEKYGSWKVEIEKGKKEKRDGKGGQRSFRQFLDGYKHEDIYLVSDVMKKNPIINELFVLRPLLCDDFLRRINKCIMWFSSGGTKSVLHFDSYENINCLFDGSKEFILGNKMHHDMFDYNTKGFSKVDVDRVDLIKFPSLGRIPWYSAKMETGDCFYIPRNWAHHVNSSQSRNLAVNFWWYRMLAFPNPEDCKKQSKDLKDFEPLQESLPKTVEPKVRTFFVDYFEKESEPITAETFYQILFSDSLVESIKEAKDIFAEIDKNQDGLVSFSELHNADVKTIEPIMQDVMSEVDETGEHYFKDEL